VTQTVGSDGQVQIRPHQRCFDVGSRKIESTYKSSRWTTLLTISAEGQVAGQSLKS